MGGRRHHRNHWEFGGQNRKVLSQHKLRKSLFGGVSEKKLLHHQSPYHIIQNPDFEPQIPTAVTEMATPTQGSNYCKVGVAITETTLGIWGSKLGF